MSCGCEGFFRGEAPLDDPAYAPMHPPVGGVVPAVVGRWGRASQLRWFRRFWHEVDWRQDVSGYWVQSVAHRGPCCWSCAEEAGEGRGVCVEGYCCCQGVALAA